MKDITFTKAIVEEFRTLIKKDGLEDYFLTKDYMLSGIVAIPDNVKYDPETTDFTIISQDEIKFNEVIGQVPVIYFYGTNSCREFATKPIYHINDQLGFSHSRVFAFFAGRFFSDKRINQDVLEYSPTIYLNKLTKNSDINMLVLPIKSASDLYKKYYVSLASYVIWARRDVPELKDMLLFGNTLLLGKVRKVLYKEFNKYAELWKKENEGRIRAYGLSSWVQADKYARHLYNAILYYHFRLYSTYGVATIINSCSSRLPNGYNNMVEKCMYPESELRVFKNSLLTNLDLKEEDLDFTYDVKQTKMLSEV